MLFDFDTLDHNAVYILDKDNLIGLKEYAPVKVRIVKYVGKKIYMVVPIEPIVYPILTNGYAAKIISVHKDFLKKSSMDENVVIRCPLNVPKFSKHDVDNLLSVINLDSISEEQRDALTSIYYKINYSLSFEECIDINV